MKQNWSEEELAVHWSLSKDESNQIDSRTDHGLLGFAVLLKYIKIEGRFPQTHREDLKTEDEPDYKASVFSQLKSDPGRAGLGSIEKEVAKLKTIHQLELPSNLLSTTSPKVLKRYQLRAATESVWAVRRHTENTRYTLLTIFCWQRRQEIIDGMLDLLIQIVHKISVGAEKKVEGKTTLLFKLAEVILNQPDGMIKDVVFPVVGEDTLQALVKEYHSQGPSYQRKVHQFVRRSFSHHYRRINLEAILTKPINWELIRQQYDEMIKYATALRLGTAEAEAILGSMFATEPFAQLRGH